jgi:hypothetical protein
MKQGMKVPVKVYTDLQKRITSLHENSGISSYSVHKQEFQTQQAGLPAHTIFLAAELDPVPHYKHLSFVHS